MFYLSMIGEYFKNYFKSKLTYRMDFWIEVISDLLFNGLNLLFILIVFQQTDLLGEWNREETLFIYGYFMIPYGIFSAFFGLWGFSERYIVKGEMDRILTRPMHHLGQLMLENLDPSSLMSSLAGCIILVYAWVHVGIPFDWTTPFVFCFLVMGSMLIYAGMYIALTATAFFADAPTGILPLMWNIQNYGRYPITIYNRLIRTILTVVLPFAFVGFYPAAYFLDPVHWSRIALLTPVVGVIFFTIGMLIWNMGIKRYRGAGS
jgi:ABC-2 type transport system permease protein